MGQQILKWYSYLFCFIIEVFRGILFVPVINKYSTFSQDTYFRIVIRRSILVDIHKKDSKKDPTRYSLDICPSENKIVDLSITHRISHNENLTCINVMFIYLYWVSAQQFFPAATLKRCRSLIMLAIIPAAWLPPLHFPIFVFNFFFTNLSSWKIGSYTYTSVVQLRRSKVIDRIKIKCINKIEVPNFSCIGKIYLTELLISNYLVYGSIGRFFCLACSYI